MSARNGDKARFGKDRKRRIAQRKRNRELQAELGKKKTSAIPAKAQ